MKKIIHALREEPERRPPGDRSAMFSLERVIVQSVEDLWTLLPENLLQSAENQWQEALPRSEVVEKMHCSRYVTLGELILPSASMATPINALQCEFEETARVFKDSLPDSIPLDEILKVTSSNDVYDITDKIQQTGGGLRNLPKMRLYLERLKGYTGVINDIIDGSRDVLALLWGPIALLLQWSRTPSTAYDSIINVAAEIGQALPDFQASAAIFDQNMEAKEILMLFFKDILNFYREALEPFSRPSWMHVFDRMWPKHNAHILEVARHIGRLTRLMRTEIRLEHIKQEYEFRKDALEGFKAQKREARRQEFHRIMTFLSPCRYDDTLHRLRDRRCEKTGGWLFMDETFTKWLNNSQEENRILWLKGIPGAGKTVLSSAIVDKLRCTQGTTTAFAFLTYQEAKTSALSITHSLIFQLAGRDEDLMAIICDSMVDDLKNDLTAAINLLSPLIQYVGSVYLVIDGIDEISETERRRLVIELLRLAKICERLRIILSSRSEADIMRLLDETAVVIPVHDHNEESIKDYIHERSQYIFHTRKIFPKAQVEIRKLLVPLANRAKGMFLYARLIMDTIATMHDMSEILKELAVLPESLDHAYHRIIVRLGDHKDKRKSEQARRLLGWVACTSTPLTIEDAQQALVVRPGNRDQVFDIVAKLDVIEVLGPIVETVDTYIRFVHFTAKEYISSPHLGAQLIDMNQATLDLAMRCIEYICQRHHDPGLTAKERSENVSTGQYSFHAFSTRMWFDLVCQYLRSIKSASPSANLIDVIQMLWEARKIQDFDSTVRGGSEDESDNEATLGTLDVKHPLLHQLLCRTSRFRNSSFQFTGKTNRDSQKEKRDPLTISATSQRIRQALDDALCNSPTGWLISGEPGCHENCAYILQYYGPRPFKCRFPQCEFWQHGFQKRVSRNRHEHSHDNPLTCPVPGCESGLIGFLSERMLQSHFKQAHQSDPPQVSFDGQDLAQDGVEALLSDLVQEDQVGVVQKVLSTFPNALQVNDSRHKLRMLAAFAASDAMLELLEEPADYDEAKLVSEAWADCIAESIKGRNGSTLRYLLSRAKPFFDSKLKIAYGSADFFRVPEGKDHSRRVLLISQLVSNDWLEGMKICAKWLRSGLNIFPSRGPNLTLIKRLLGGNKTILAAASHSLGDQQLLCLWRDSGIVAILDQKWASQTLRSVAEFGCSITLATYLLGHGANINARPGSTRKTALHCAACNTSAEGAEMIRFLLLNGADPEADQKTADSAGKRRGKKIRDEEGANGIHRWLGKTWDELIEETKRIRHDREAGKELISTIGEGKEIGCSDREHIAK
ncbi:uncharacterized protein LY89DRAFT_69875 [Mollisia scopiformis]|uniref:NACHT domain-containing protein n=1 Tax=Mollisia scopiformis TaxID=149040 RepID=A0A194XA48_MOLSC|nr:uncharacterized protein LY89DRAFT_69875 [Mollisia scopiformis]KUJ17014.1 hypothetical protein LY89DRAFT_69875 [Mollisia scopiformis]